MGLGAVELLMAVEDRFGITIPDRDANTLTTVADLYAYLMQRHADMPAPPADASQLWEQLAAVIAREGRMAPEAVHPEALIWELFE